MASTGTGTLLPFSRMSPRGASGGWPVRRSAVAPRDEDVVAGRAGLRLDPGRDVDGVADDAEVQAPAAADRPRHDRPELTPTPIDSPPAAAATISRAAATARSA